MPPTPEDPPSRIGAGLVAFAVLLVALLNLAALARPDAGLLRGQLADADSYLRLLRVLDLRIGAAWFDDLNLHVAAPEGIVIQWTRPVDLLILLPGLALERLGGLPPRDALFVAGVLLSPVLHVAAAVAAAWAAQAIWPGRAPWYAVLLVGASPAAVIYSAAGRADHHTLILLAIMLGLGAALRALRPGGRDGPAVAAGLCFGFGVWVGPEVLIVAIPVLTAGGIAAVVAADGRHAARQGLRMALGMAGMVALAIAAERAPADWAGVAYDAVSVHHLALALLMAAVFVAAGLRAQGPRPARLVVAGLAAATAVAVLVLAFPDALRGPLGSVDEAYLRHLHPTIEENLPLPPFGPGTGWDVLSILGGGAVLAALALALAAPGWVRGGTWPAGLALALAFLACLAAAFGARRFALDLAAPAAVAGAGLVGAVLHGAWPRAEGARAAVAALCFFGGLGLPVVGLGRAAAPPAASAAAPPAEACDWTAMARWLDLHRPGVEDATPAPVLMAADLFIGSEIAWRTPYRSVAAPHHRGGGAIADTVLLLDAPGLEAARAVLARRGAALLLVCPGDAAVAGRTGALVAAIRAGRLPAWLAPVALPDGLAGFSLLAVTQGG
jgi:asparagine N-glycosylation enzyme membrane subunit Stt3